MVSTRTTQKPRFLKRLGFPARNYRFSNQIRKQTIFWLLEVSYLDRVFCVFLLTWTNCDLFSHVWGSSWSIFCEIGAKFEFWARNCQFFIFFDFYGLTAAETIMYGVFSRGEFRKTIGLRVKLGKNRIKGDFLVFSHFALQFSHFFVSDPTFTAPLGA